MKINRSNASQKFNAYVKDYDINNEKIRLKIEHTYKVAKLCEEIAKSESLSEEDTDMAWLIGLLHDIGRFEQLRRFNTFIDSQSIDHAAFGADLLFVNGLIREFVKDNSCDILMEKAIRTHNAFRLPDDFDERTLMFCNILRDADKIDILRVNVETPLEEIYNVSTEKLRNDEISEKVLGSFFEESATLRAYKKTSVDNLAGHISLVYELVYPYSIREAHRQGFLYKIMDFQSDNPHTREQFLVIKKQVASYLDKRLEKSDISGGKDGA